MYLSEKRDIESRAALLARQRDLKRRRQTYRAKNVHITRRSQTEVSFIMYQHSTVHSVSFTLTQQELTKAHCIKILWGAPPIWRCRFQMSGQVKFLSGFLI